MRIIIGMLIILTGGLIALAVREKLDTGAGYLLGFITGHVSAFVVYAKSTKEIK